MSGLPESGRFMRWLPAPLRLCPEPQREPRQGETGGVGGAIGCCVHENERTLDFLQAAVNALWRCANQEVKLGTNAPRFGINSPRRSDLLPVIYSQ